ncbi:MAG: hypothetical protein CUN55_08915 [Phototrophicales bacterium]|nr:MAG: hypothetical protein CUN55_08915 [Phototrophicales bacterium]
MSFYRKTYVSVALDNATDGFQAGRNIAQQAIEKLSGHPPTIALLFVSHPLPKQVLEGVLSVLGDVPLVGGTSAGEYSHEGYVEDGAGLMLIHAEDIRFYPFGYKASWWRRSRSLLGQLVGISPDGLGSRYNHRSLILFPDDHSMDLDNIIEQAMSETGMLYDILGGPSPTVNQPPPRLPMMFFNRKSVHQGMVGLEILSQHAFGLSIANGWQPLSGPYRITSSDKGLIITIDGRPAREVYEDFFDELGLSPIELDGPQLLKYPIGVCHNATCRVSLAMGFERNGALKVTTAPPPNTIIHILSTQPSSMINAAQRAIQSALRRVHATPVGLLFIDCMSTSMLLGESYSQQQKVVQESVGDVPFLGFRSHGVLARLVGQTSGHYECSVGTWVIPG